MRFVSFDREICDKLFYRSMSMLFDFWLRGNESDGVGDKGITDQGLRIRVDSSPLSRPLYIKNQEF